MTTDHTPYRVMQSSEYAPGNCWVTGSAMGPFIDTGIYIPKERFGQLVLGKDFIAEAARLLGLFADIEDRIDRAYDAGYAEAQKEKLDGRVDDLLERIGDLTDALRDIRGDGVVPVEAAPAVAGGTPEHAGGVDGGDASPVGAAGQGARDARDEGPVGVSAGPSDEFSNPFRV